jgi:hypothetical protein
MRTSLLCLLFCLACGGCANSAGRCQGPQQPINPPQSKSVPSATDPDASLP